MTTTATQKYWLNIVKGWILTREGRGTLPTPQAEEAAQVMDDLEALLGAPAAREPSDANFDLLCARLSKILTGLCDEETIGAVLNELRAYRVGLETLSAYPDEAQHVYQHQARDAAPLINSKVERNSRGFNWEATVTGARSVAEAIELTALVMDSLGRVYGAQNADLAAAKPPASSKGKGGKKDAPALPEDEAESASAGDGEG